MRDGMRTTAPPKTCRRQRGATIAEAAVTLPIFFILIFAMFEFGILMSAYQSMADAAREGARYGVAPLASGGYALPSAGSIAQQACTYLNASTGGGNPACPGYSGGTGTPPVLSSCTDSAFLSTSAAENIYVGLPPTTSPESYSVNGSTMNEQLVVVGIRKKVPLHILGLTVNLRTCAAMRSENN